jgi:hypothetical protein
LLRNSPEDVLRAGGTMEDPCRIEQLSREHHPMIDALVAKGCRSTEAHYRQPHQAAMTIRGARVGHVAYCSRSPERHFTIAELSGTLPLKMPIIAGFEYPTIVALGTTIHCLVLLADTLSRLRVGVHRCPLVYQADGMQVPSLPK